jgi:rfaE bifunctional protein kinase chain/domain
VTFDRTLLQERLTSIVRRFPQQGILVIGDSIADQFVYGGISRVSREAPVFILRHEHTETVPGGAANCAVNLASLGASVSLISCVGTDEAGRSLAEKLEAAGVNCKGVIISEFLRTTTKVRILAGQSHSTRQQVIRLDYEDQYGASSNLRQQFGDKIREQAGMADAVIVSDYNYGVADPSIAKTIRDVTASKNTPVLIDSRFRLTAFSEFTSATPNEDEVEQLLATRFNGVEQLESAGEQLRERLGFRALLITRGSLGLTLFENGVSPLHLQAIGPREPVDVTGAGDTVIATYTLALASDASFPDAARLANYAGGLVVMKRGTASVTGDELENSILHSELS